LITGLVTEPLVFAVSATLFGVMSFALTFLESDSFWITFFESEDFAYSPGFSALESG